MFDYCKNCKNHDDCFNNNWCVTMDRGRKIEGEYICDNFEPTLNSKIIFLRDIVKLQHYYIEIFEEEDSDFVNYKRVGALYRQVYKILNSITDVEQDKTKIYDIIGHGSWNSEDHSFKPICDDIRKLGYKVVERMNEQEKQAIKNAERILEKTTFLSDIGHKDLEILVDLINKQDKVISLMADVLNDFDYDKQCEECHTDICSASVDGTEYTRCIKEYYYKKAGGENEN